MKTVRGTLVSVCSRVQVPIQLAWGALRKVLDELEAEPGSGVLEVVVPGVPGAKLSVPVKIATTPGNSRYELNISIEAAARAELFPVFHGVIALVHTLADTCDLRLDGKYRVPLSSLGSIVDMTLLANTASESLERFVGALARDVAARVKVASG
jgi:hypothetical protein